LSATEAYKVAILGAGPAGAACALALTRRGVDRVCLLDAGRAPTGAAIGETIPPDARTLLDRLGLWQAFLAEGHEPCLGSCSSWGSDVLGFNDFVLNPHGNGWHLDRARFDDFLRRHARAAGATVLEGAHFLDVEEGGECGYRLSVASGMCETRTLHARFVVDATGPRSAFARRVGARQIVLDRLTFVYGFFDATNAVSRTRLTLLEAAENGWLYAACLPGSRLAVALAAEADTVRYDGLTRDARWLARALDTRHLAPRLDGCRFLAGSLTARVVTSFMLDKVAGRRWLATGDAAAVFDPLAAQGIYKALADGIDAAAHVAAALERGDSLADGFAAGARARFDEYLVNRNYFYGLERRWPASAFWRRRQSRTALAAAA
jgi:flavin-dependent dehydrogenase